ncbi:AMP-binding protein [Saccharothrix longispora]|uniref:AMP-binding protein n=1 Tax=Saccharothrix longispora TaxID=33920 RepID=UPI0028FD8407|nr:AMP-binding protein [Saccharothrix longispora]MDU0294209.1 AMP-binding protein [Saccharothrix longispora]
MSLGDLVLLPLDVFAARVSARPDAVAVVFGERRMSFADLDRESDRVAQVLRRRGIGLESRVGLCVARGFGMAVGVLGVLKSGAAYVPLDPSYPEGRLRWLAEDADVAAVLTESGLSGPWDGMPVVHLEDSAAESSLVRPGPLNTACVFHTSGSTGQPKGVAVEHRNLAHVWAVWEEIYGLVADPPCFVSVTGLAVDLFLADLLRSVFAGGTLVIASDEERADAGRLLDLIGHHDRVAVCL